MRGPGNENEQRGLCDTLGTEAIGPENKSQRSKRKVNFVVVVCFVMGEEACGWGLKSVSSVKSGDQQ